MEFNNICKIAYDYYKRHLNIEGLCSCVDIGEYYVFSAGDPNITNYGGCMITVDKNNHTIDMFDTIENIPLLMQGKKVKISNEYKYKAS